MICFFTIKSISFLIRQSTFKHLNYSSLYFISTFKTTIYLFVSFFVHYNKKCIYITNLLLINWDLTGFIWVYCPLVDSFGTWQLSICGHLHLLLRQQIKRNVLHQLRRSHVKSQIRYPRIPCVTVSSHIRETRRGRTITGPSLTAAWPQFAHHRQLGIRIEAICGVTKMSVSKVKAEYKRYLYGIYITYCI